MHLIKAKPVSSVFNAELLALELHLLLMENSE